MSDTSVADNFKNLPIKDLVVGPLVAAADGQQALVGSYILFLNSMFDKDGKPRSLDMEVERPVFNPDTKETSYVKSTIKAPLLGLIPIAALLIKTIDIEFSMEVKSSYTEKESSNTSASAEVGASGRFWGVSVSSKFTGSTSSQKENTRSTDQSAKYAVRIHAEQMQPPETLSRLLDLLNQTVEPIAIGDKTAPGATAQ